MIQPVRGTHDIFGTECQKYLKIIEIARHLSDLYDYQEIITPIFEFSDVFHRLGESTDVVSKETYTFLDRGGASLTLRPEGTASMVRAVLSNGLTQHLPLRLFYVGPMFRYERPQKGRYRQFDQIGVELCGIAEAHADVEVISLANHLLKELHLSDDIILEINTLGDKSSRAGYRQALVHYFSKFSGSLSEDSLKRLSQNPLRILDSKDPKDQEIVQDAPLLSRYLTPEAQCYFDDLLKGLENLNISYKVNQKLVRGLDYYCHTAFEFISDKLGAQGTVLGGGRYDGLFKAMDGPDISGVGWASGVQRLMLLSSLEISSRPDLCLIPLDEGCAQFSMKLAQDLRHHRIKTHISSVGHLSKKLKYAHKIKARWALVIGEDELKSRHFMLRDLDQGQQQQINQTDLIQHLRNLRDTL